jgi:predicted nucleic acid-binding protein
LELRKVRHGRADQRVMAWATGISATTLFLSVISILELEQGVLLVERRDATQGAMLRAWMDRQVLSAFAGRILAVDTTIAQRCARLHVPDPRSERDAMVTATALVHGLEVVTRNVGDFAATGLKLVDPWQ